MINGYMQKVLFVDVTSKSAVEKPLPDKIYRDFIGGQGLGVRVLYEHMAPHADPLGPENIIGFVTSPLTGAGFHGARLQVVGKSPITGGWGDSNVGGIFAVALKASGYDGVFIKGSSPKPMYLYLNDGDVQFKDASHLWGKDTVETEAANPDIAERMAQARLERSIYLSAHAPDVMFVLAKAVHTIFMAYDPEVLIIGGGVGTAPGFFHALIRSVETLRHRFDVAREFLDPSRMVVLSPDDPIATESALILAKHARASTKAAISA